MDHGSRLLVDIANLFSLTQLIEEPTRITSSSSTLIDHIFTNSPDKISCAGVSHVSISDHSLIYAYRKLSTDRATKGHSSVNYRSFKNFDPAKFRHDIENQKWAYVGEFEDPDEMWHVWKAIFNCVVDKHAPFCTKRVRAFKSPWISSQLKDEMHKRDAQKFKAIRSNDLPDWFLFRKMRNSVNQNIFRAKESYFKDILFANKNNPKKTWNIINELTSKNQKSSYIEEIKFDGNSIHDSGNIANTFNEYFSNIGPNLANEINTSEGNRCYLMYLNRQNENTTFNLEEVNSRTGFFHLSNLSKSKATGLDGISARLLRECPDLISESLTLIFNRSINTGIFPDEWKYAKVIPIHKHGKRNCTDNYRPISIIPVVAKVFERIIYNQLSLFFSENGLLNNCQSGFRGLHSTVTALLEATNEWAYNIDSGKVNAVMFLDLKKAFDTVDHEILLGKLKLYGVHGIAGNWLRSYLNNRKQRCYVNGHLSSNYRFMHCGVPYWVHFYS